MITEELPRILIADADTRLSRILSKFLTERGFKCKTAHDAHTTLQAIKGWDPSFIIYDMMLPGLNAIEFLNRLSSGKVKTSEDSIIMVISSHNAPSNINACMSAGASDFIKKPFAHQDILARLAFHMQTRKAMQEMSEEQLKKRGEYYLYLTELFLKKAVQSELDTHEQLFQLLNMQAMALGAVRCSFVQTHQEDLVGTVLRSSDDKNFSGFCLQLQKYPEIITVLHSQKMVAIDDLNSNSTMAQIKKDFRQISFNSMVVSPVFVENQLFGVISSRRKEDAPPLTDADLRFSQTIAHVCGLLLRIENPYTEYEVAAS